MEYTNKKAYHDYEILDKIEAGVVLNGCEVKSIRDGGGNLRDSFAKITDKGEVWLNGLRISAYKNSPEKDQNPERPKKLLLKKEEIKRLQRKVIEKGVTIIPTRMYFTRGKVKVELGVARGKKVYDKRKAIAKRDSELDIKREMKEKD